ncbi:6-phosphogluconolactonase [Corynebacterium caspium]|uniref:6-phosphogluconolactonase n=1 Tax=Corynebacterium caspium TaxID=234828 RepID=UPI000381EB33|nr:6-phosphogluconolactonase [Corynebacterium caspium]WKD59253.1 6-phosphogluconolactonase [Corynebacterium caspium DSM 44850]
MLRIEKVADLAALTTTAAADFMALIQKIQQPQGGVHGDGIARIVLTGGTAGIEMLQKIAELEVQAAAIDWSRVHLFFGDERNVAVSHPDSNEGQARKALLATVAIPENNIHGFNLGELSLDVAVAAYSAVLAEYAPQGFDLHLLGMGGEGHINSIFPHTAAVQETAALVMAVKDSPKPPAERVTLTMPAIAKAQRVWLLVSGSEKALAASHVVAGSPAIEWPAAGARGSLETVLYVSADAATQIAT